VEIHGLLLWKLTSAGLAGLSGNTTEVSSCPGKQCRSQQALKSLPSDEVSLKIAKRALIKPAFFAASVAEAIAAADLRNSGAANAN
jgi:hypothetical protein